MSYHCFEITNGIAEKRLILRQLGEGRLTVSFWDILECKTESYEVPHHHFYSFLPMLLERLESEGEQTPESIADWLGEPLIRVSEPV